MKNILSKKTLTIVFHILIWVLLFFLPRFFILHPFQRIGTTKETFLWISAILFFYLNYNILVTKLLTKRKFFLFALTIFSILNFTFISSVFIDSHWEAQRNGDPTMMAVGPPEDFQNKEQFPADTPEFDKNRLDPMQYMGGFISVLFIFVVLAVSTSIKITSHWYSDEKILKDAENQKLNAELSQLKLQINPHFFFNTLNSIYSLASKKSDKTPEAIIKLSQLMRYIIYDSEKDLVPLQNEIEYITNFVELQKLRIHKNVIIDLAIHGVINDKWIEPLLLLPFIENAFKHGIDNRSCTIKIRIAITGERLFFETENPIVDISNQPWSNVASNHNSGIGLANSKKRLSLLYPESHTLAIVNKNDMFKINLQLTFKSPTQITKVS